MPRLSSAAILIFGRAVARFTWRGKSADCYQAATARERFLHLLIAEPRASKIVAMKLAPLVMFAIGTAAMLYYRREIQEILNNLSGRGPRPPSHPLPADDARLLRRRFRRQ